MQNGSLWVEDQINEGSFLLRLRGTPLFAFAAGLKVSMKETIFCTWKALLAKQA
jgi:hypothetical protein